MHSSEVVLLAHNNMQMHVVTMLDDDIELLSQVAILYWTSYTLHYA